MGLAALLADGDAAALKVDLAEVEVADGGAAHAGLDQGVDDRPVAPGPVALAPGTLVGELDVLAAAAVVDPPAEDRQMVGGVEELAPLALGERPLDLEARAGEDGLQFLGRVAEAEGPQGMDPLGEGLQVRGDAGDRAVGEAPAAVLIELVPEGIEERPRQAARPAAAVDHSPPRRA